MPRLDFRLTDENYRLIKLAARQKGVTVRAFAAVTLHDAALEVTQHVYYSPSGKGFQHEIVIRAIENGACTIEDITKETGLEELAVCASLHELIMDGKVEKETKQGRKAVLFTLRS